MNRSTGSDMLIAFTFSEMLYSYCRIFFSLAPLCFIPFSIPLLYVTPTQLLCLPSYSACVRLTFKIHGTKEVALQDLLFQTPSITCKVNELLLDCAVLDCVFALGVRTSQK